MSRDVTIFGRYWKATTFSSIVQPTIYLLAFGLGLRSVAAARAGHVTYVQYVGDGRRRDSRALLVGLSRHVQHVRALAVPAHLRRDARRAGGRRGADHRGGAVDLDPRRRLRHGAAARRHRLRAAAGAGHAARPVHRLSSRASASRRSASPSPRSRRRSTTSTTSRARCSRRCFSWRARSSRSPRCRSACASIAQFNPLFHCVQLVRDASLPAIGLGLVDLGSRGACSSSSRCSCGAWRSPSWAGG